MDDKINHPAHYTKYNVEVIDITRYLPFCLGNVVKYVLRAPYKGGVEDCDKALWYLGRIYPYSKHTIWLPICAYDNLRENILRLQAELERGNDVEKTQAKILGYIQTVLVCGEVSSLEYWIGELRKRLAGFPDEASYQFYLGYTKGKEENGN